MNGFLRHCLDYAHKDDLWEALRDYRKIAEDQNKIIGFQQQEIGRLKLEYTKWGRECLQQFLIALDQPENEEELRKRLYDAVWDMTDEIARLEEHVSTSPS